MRHVTTGDDVLGGMDPARWDQLAGSNFYSASMWLRQCATYPDAVCRAVVSTSGGTAAVPVATFTAPPPANYHWSKILATRGLPAPAPVGTLVGPRQGYQAHLLGTAGDESRTAGLVQEIRNAHSADWMAARGAAHDRPCVAMYLTTADVTAIRLAGVQATPLLLEPDAWIEVPDGGWEAWLATLTSNRRKSIRHEVRRFSEAGCTIAHRPLAECYERLVPAAVAMGARYGLSTNPDYFTTEFKRYIEWTGPAARVAVCTRDGGEPLGFCIYYVWADTIFLRWASFNYALLTGSTEYFNVSYYSQIRLAASIGARWLHAGKKAIGAKVLRGAKLRPLWLLDLSENSVLADHADEIRAHNAYLVAALDRDRRTARAIADRADWDLYC